MPMPSPFIASAMAYEPRRVVRALGLSALAAWALCGSLPASAQVTKPSPPIFQCIDASGKKITSDRPIPECTGRDLRKLNPDGSLNSIVPPPLTADERSEKEQKERDDAAERTQKNDAIRRDRNLMQRYPDEAKHRKAREKALDDLRLSEKNSEARITLLNVEHKKLMDEAEFYKNKQMPSKLRQAIDANDASLEAQNALAQNQQAEVGRINAFYDIELARLKKLWTGTPAGSLGPMPGPQQQAAPASTKAATK